MQSYHVAGEAARYISGEDITGDHSSQVVKGLSVS